MELIFKLLQDLLFLAHTSTELLTNRLQWQEEQDTLCGGEPCHLANEMQDSVSATRKPHLLGLAFGLEMQASSFHRGNLLLSH